MSEDIIEYLETQGCEVVQYHGGVTYSFYYGEMNGKPQHWIEHINSYSDANIVMNAIEQELCGYTDVYRPYC